MTTTATCPSCSNPQQDGILCAACCDRIERQLGDVSAIVADLQITISKQDRIGNGGGKSGKGWAREKLPINAGGVEAADHLANILTSWVRDISDDAWRPRDIARQSQAAARYLLSHIPEIRRHPAVSDLVDEVDDAIKQARRVVDRPADRVYFGTCLSETPDEDGRTVTCIEEIWASPSALEVQCKVCAAEWEIAERRAWLLQQAADMLVTIPYASELMGDVGHIKVTQASIRGYLHRGRIAYRAPIEAKRIRLGDLLAVVVDEGERKSA